MPTSIHGKTGRVTRILDLDSIFDFNPEDEPSIFTDMDEKQKKD